MWETDAGEWGSGATWKPSCSSAKTRRLCLTCWKAVRAPVGTNSSCRNRLGADRNPNCPAATSVLQRDHRLKQSGLDLDLTSLCQSRLRGRREHTLTANNSSRRNSINTWFSLDLLITVLQVPRDVLQVFIKCSRGSSRCDSFFLFTDVPTIYRRLIKAKFTFTIRGFRKYLAQNIKFSPHSLW